MGLQTTQDLDQPPSDMSSATTQTSPDSQRTPDVSSLPPEALDLAAQLFDLARTGNTPSLQQYIEAGIPPNLTNRTGDTLLMLASYHGHVETVRMLLANGADTNACNERGQSPIAGAVFKGFDDVVQALNAAGADIHGGRPSAVDAARMFRRQRCCEILGVEMGEAGDVQMPPGMVPRAPPS